MNEHIEKKVDETWKDKAKEEPPVPEHDHKTPEPSFRLFITSLAMQAWINLGIIPNPVTDKTQEDLAQAKFLIDSIEMLEKKTKGNLDKEEAEMLEHLLYELRMAFVNASTKG